MSRLEGQPNLSQFAEAVVGAASEQIRCAIPGLFRSVRNDLKYGTVQPAISRENSGQDPVIPDVPIMFPRWRGGSITWPVQSGDQCLIVFSDRSTEEWEDKTGNSVVTPSDPRTHDFTDAIAIPMGISATGSGGGTLKIDCGAGGKVAIGNSAAELLGIVSDFINFWIVNSGKIAVGVAPGAPLPLFPDIVPALEALKLQINSIKGSL